MGGRDPERYPPSIGDHQILRDWGADNPAWAIGVYCERCIHSGAINPRKFRHRYVRRIGDLKARLYCTECHSRAFRIRPLFLMRRD
jgi:hypothetical protein